LLISEIILRHTGLLAGDVLKQGDLSVQHFLSEFGALRPLSLPDPPDLARIIVIVYRRNVSLSQAFSPILRHGRGSVLDFGQRQGLVCRWISDAYMTPRDAVSTLRSLSPIIDVSDSQAMSVMRLTRRFTTILLVDV